MFKKVTDVITSEEDHGYGSETHGFIDDYEPLDSTETI
ncbi:hypothetical protein GD1_47 [Paraglaciecola Antarctic GD virus 1]|nr:hypothetical protein GD1_47 [Paraglaciecola Antarctic GD virus 1]